MQPTPPPELNAVLDRIRSWAKANDMKPATMARRAGISEVVTRGMDEPTWSPTSKSIRALEGLIPDGWQAGDPAPAQPTDQHSHPEAA